MWFFFNTLASALFVPVPLFVFRILLKMPVDYVND